MGGSRYIRLRILLAFYIFATLVPTLQLSQESPATAAVSVWKNCLFGSDYQIFQSTTARLFSDFWSKLDYYQRYSPQSPDKFDATLQLHKIKKQSQIRENVHCWYEPNNIILLYVLYVYCCTCKKAREQNNTASDEVEDNSSCNKYITSCRPDVLSILTAKFTTKTYGNKCNNDNSYCLPPQYDWIFKYSNINWQIDIQVYPVLQTETILRTATYSKLAFHEMPGMVSFLQLSDAGFRYTGYGSVVICDKCHKSLNIRDFNSSPSDVKYHEVSCSFAKAAVNEIDPVVDSDQWSSTSGLPLLSEAMLYNKEYHTSQVQLAQEIQTSGQSQWSLPAIPPQLLAAPYTHGSSEVIYASKNPGSQSSSSCYGGEVGISRDIEEDGSSTVLGLTTDIGGHLDQVNKPDVSSLASSEAKVHQHKRGTRQLTQISRNEASTTSGIGSGETQYQMSTSTTEQQQSMHPSDNGHGLTTALARVQHPPDPSASIQHPPDPSASIQHPPDPSASIQHPPDPSASGSSCTSHTQPQFVDTVDFQPEVHHSDKEVQPSSDICTKNPGHYAYFPIESFRLEYIPSNVRCPEVLRFFSVVAKLTVRVVVSSTSRKRLRLCAPNQEPKFHFGTGFAVCKPGGNYHIADTEHSGKLSGVRKFLPYGRKLGYIYIETNRHLVKDDTEAENTIVEFFYDKPDRRDVIAIKGVAVYHSCVRGDLKSVLLCRTSELPLVNMVKECEKEMQNLARHFPQNIKEGLMRRIFMLSHPHGGEKVFSFGEYVMVKYRLETTGSDGQAVTQLVKINNHTDISQNPNDIRKMLLYTMETCPGSTGGVVVSFKKTGSADTGDITLDLWMHNGVDTKHGLNASVIRTATTDDIANHGRQSVFRPSIQDDISAEADRAANQVVSSPVFTVSQPPCHPAYVTYRKRLESYPDQFTHVHTQEDLADAGFFFANYADCVRCFHCGLGLKSWRPGDVIHEEHFRNRRDCQFLLLKLRESGIDVSTLEARLQHSRRSTDVPAAAASESRRQSTEQSHAVSNTELGLNENLRGQTGEMTATVQVQEMSHSRGTEEQRLIEMAKDTRFFQPDSQNMVVNYVSNSTSDTRAPADVRSSAVRVLEREQYYLKQIFICKVCCKKPVKDLFLPCGELIACVDCSKLLTHCPSCNRKILATVTTYFS